MVTAPLGSRQTEVEIRPLKRWFFTGLALVMLLVALVGFTPSIVHEARRRASVTALAAAHGFVFVLWLVLFAVQSRLVASGRVAVHRRIGIAAAALVLPLMVILGYATTAAMVRRGFDLSGDLKIEHDPLYESVFPFGDLFGFAVLVALAVAYRRHPEIHKRLMLFGNIALMGAPLAHFIGHVPRLAAMPAAIILVPISLFLVAAIARELWLTRKVHPLTWGLALGVFLFGPLRAGLIGPSAAWHRMAEWLAR
jgi:hypothetical protein